MNKITKTALSLLALFAIGCASDQDVIYKPQAHILPSHIRRLAIRPFQNTTQQFALEDKLTLKVNNRFLTDGTYKITSEKDADGILTGTISRYIHLPVAYDSNLVAMQYKLDVVVHLQFIDKAANQVLWQEPNFVGSIAYPAATLPGGMTEEQSRELIWEQLSEKILRRTIQGFGSETGESERRIAPNAPSEPTQ
ncbi:MAG: LptE family protein [Elusimicrobiota bacterium]